MRKATLTTHEHEREIVIEQTTNQVSAIELATWLTAQNPVVSGIKHQIIVAGVLQHDRGHLDSDCAHSRGARSPSRRLASRLHKRNWVLNHD